jgi:hypothetical protein
MGLTWAINTAQCQPTTPTDLLVGAVTGGLANFIRPGAIWLKSSFFGLWRSGSNAAGGRVFTSTGTVIGQLHFAHIVDDAVKRGDDVHILTGTHGDAWGNMTPEYLFYSDDVVRFGDLPGVTVHNVPSMSSEAIREVLRSPGTIIGAFCHSKICLKPYR